MHEVLCHTKLPPEREHTMNVMQLIAEARTLDPALAMLPERQEGDNVLALAERAAPAYVTPWPFQDVTREDWRALTSDQVALVEGMVRQMVPARQGAAARALG